MKYKGIIFDLDGVLVSTDYYHYLAWKKLADELGIDFDQSINERLRGVSRMESLDIILEKSSTTFSSGEKEKFCSLKNEYYNKNIENLTNSSLIDGALKFVLAAKLRGYKIAIGSSSKNSRLILSKVGIIDLFDQIVDGNEIARSKPDPEVFLLAADKLRLCASECLVVEDAEAGILAACLAGMDTVGVAGAKDNPRATYRADSLKSFSIASLE